MGAADFFPGTVRERRRKLREKTRWERTAITSSPAKSCSVVALTARNRRAPFWERTLNGRVSIEAREVKYRIQGDGLAVADERIRRRFDSCRSLYLPLGKK